MKAKRKDKVSPSFFFFLALALVGALFFRFVAPQLFIEKKEKVYSVTVEEEIPYETQKITTDKYKDSELFEGEEVVEREGVKGIREWTYWYKDIYVNGKLYKKAEEPFKKEIVKEIPPVTEIVYVGTKKPYPTGYVWRITDKDLEHAYGVSNKPFRLDLKIENMVFENGVLRVFFSAFLYQVPLESAGYIVNLYLRDKKTGEYFKGDNEAPESPFVSLDDPSWSGYFDFNIGASQMINQINPDNYQIEIESLPGIREDLSKFWKGPIISQ